MVLVKPPFTRDKSDEEKEAEEEKYGKVSTIRYSKWEQKQIDKLKGIFDIKGNSTALKVAAFHYLIVLQHHISPRYMAWLFKKDRVRLSDYEEMDKWLKEKL